LKGNNALAKRFSEAVLIRL